jgi:hypothetical protein
MLNVMPRAFACSDLPERDHLPFSSKRVTSSNERLMAACEIRSERSLGTRWKVCMT